MGASFFKTVSGLSLYHPFMALTALTALTAVLQGGLVANHHQAINCSTTMPSLNRRLFTQAHAQCIFCDRSYTIDRFAHSSNYRRSMHGARRRIAEHVLSMVVHGRARHLDPTAAAATCSAVQLHSRVGPLPEHVLTRQASMQSSMESMDSDSYPHSSPTTAQLQPAASVREKTPTSGKQPGRLDIKQRLTRIQIVPDCDQLGTEVICIEQPPLLLLGPYVLRRLASASHESMFSGGTGQPSAAATLQVAAEDAPCTLKMRAMHWGKIRGLGRAGR